MANMKQLLNARHAEHAEQKSGGSIARAGTVAKRSSDAVALHPHMSPAAKAGAGSGGQGHAVTAGTPGAAPLPHAFGSAADLKTGKSVAPAFAQRSRTNEDCADKSADHGRDMLAQAVKC